MSGAGSGSALKRPKNPLLFGADLGFPFDNMQGSAILMPIAHEESCEPIADASKPPTNVLPPEPIPPPASTIPSAAAPLFSLFKHALGGLSEPALPVPQPAPEPASEVPLYAPTAAPIPVPLFDPKTLEVNDNEPTEDSLNGNPPVLSQQSVSFFDPSRFQANIASLRGAGSPAQFTQLPPPDLPAPTPKLEPPTINNQGTNSPVFTTAPSQAPSTMSLSTAMETNFSPELKAPQEQAVETPVAAPPHEQGYGDQNYGNQYYNQYYNQNAAYVQQQQSTEYPYGQQELAFAQPPVQPPQFYDPSQYFQGQVEQQQQKENPVQTPTFFDPSNFKAQGDTLQHQPPVDIANQNAHSQPQFYNPNQYSQYQQEELPRRESLPQEVPIQNDHEHQTDQVVSQSEFYNPNQFAQFQQEETPRRDSMPCEAQQDIPETSQLQHTENIGQSAIQPQFYNPSQYAQVQQSPTENYFAHHEEQVSSQHTQEFSAPPQLPISGHEYSVPQPVNYYPPGQFAAENPETVPLSEAEESLPTPPAIEQNNQLENSIDNELAENVSLMGIQEYQKVSPQQSEASIPEPEPPAEPINVYNIPHNTSIFNTIPSESKSPTLSLPAEPPVSSTPLSSYFSQKHDSRPSSVASNRSQLASFFDRQDTPTALQQIHKSAAEFFDSPQSFSAQQPNTFGPSTPLAANTSESAANAFCSSIPNQPAANIFNQSQPPAQPSFFTEQAVLQQPTIKQQVQEQVQPPVQEKSSVAQFFAPATTSSPALPNQSYPPQVAPPQLTQQPSQIQSPPIFPPQSSPQENPVAQFFNPANVSSTQSNIFTPTAQVPPPQPAAASFFTPQQPSYPPGGDSFTNSNTAKSAFPVQPALSSPPAALQPPPTVQNLPPASFQAPIPSAPSPATTPPMTEEAPTVQLFNPTNFGLSQKSEGPSQGEGNKFRIKSALNKYALPPSLANSTQNYFAPPPSMPTPTIQTTSHISPSAPAPMNYFGGPQEHVDPPPAAPAQGLSSFFAPAASLFQKFNLSTPTQEPVKCNTPPNTPAVVPVTTNTMASTFFNPTESGKITEISEEAVNQAFFASVPRTSAPTEPPSIPVTISHINPTHPAVINPYSNSAALKQQLQQPLQQVPFFTPAAQQDVSVNSTESSSSPVPPPPSKAAMSGGNNYRLNSRPQYAQVPGLGSSVSAIASLAASMAMSSPIPTNSAESHDGFAPVPSIAVGASGATDIASQSLPADSSNVAYKPVTQHWFYKKQVENRAIWSPFSKIDNEALEAAFLTRNKEAVVATDGGRYDVNVHERKRVPIYWDQPPNEVRRCSWFYKNPLDSRSCPYEENFAYKLEEEYMTAHINNRWPRRVELSFGEAIVFSGPAVMSHIPPTSGSILEDWGTIQETGTKSRIVRRGCDDFDIDEGESGKPDHLLFLVHGIGSVCDLKFRTVVEVVDDFRTMSLTLIRSHFKQAGENGNVSRVEVLPVSWHGALHGEETGIDQQLQNITLKSIPRLRHFTNDTLLDILFYTSPVYCQTIIQTVGHELNRIYQLFLQRNPSFGGGISLGGHSLGSLILFDLLCHQKPPKKAAEPEMFTTEDVDEDETGHVMSPPTLIRRDSCKIEYMTGHGGTGQPSIHYPQLHFNPLSFFALGSPVGMFVTVRGIESLGVDFSFPNCPGFFNIFHPYDPVAYRIEALVNPELSKLRPLLIPHHKGRKRMHIELRETMTRVGTDIKEKLVDSVKSTWNTVYQLAMFNRGENLEEEVDKVLAEQMMAADPLADDQYPDGFEIVEPDQGVLGKLNGGRRVDYVLQEAPFESFNQYIFALSSHCCYWESEDTMLMMLKEIYNSLGVSPDRQFDRTRENSAIRDIPRERSWSGGSKSSKGSPSSSAFLSPNSFPLTSPMSGPPPTSGFVRK